MTEEQKLDLDRVLWALTTCTHVKQTHAVDQGICITCTAYAMKLIEKVRGPGANWCDEAHDALAKEVEKATEAERKIFVEADVRLREAFTRLIARRS